MFNTFKIDELTIGVVDGEPCHRKSFFICVGFVTTGHKLYNVFSLPNSSVSSPR